MCNFACENARRELKLATQIRPILSFTAMHLIVRILIHSHGTRGHDYNFVILNQTPIFWKIVSNITEQWYGIQYQMKLGIPLP
jgi:hypothetical protein